MEDTLYHSLFDPQPEISQAKESLASGTNVGQAIASLGKLGAEREP